MQLKYEPKHDLIFNKKKSLEYLTTKLFYLTTTMKPLTEKHFLIKPLRACSELLSSFWLSPQEQSFLQKVKSKEKPISKSSRIESFSSKMIRVLADRVAAVRNSKSITKAFPRFVTGLVLLVWVAPYADTFYTQLDFNDRVSPDVWYYESYHWLFLCLGPYMKSLLTTIGLYMCFVHKNSPIKTALAAYCLMFDVGKIIWLLMVQNHDEYRTLTPKMFLIYGFVTASFLLYIVDLLSFWFNHRVMAIKSRLQGLRLIADKVEPQIAVASFCATMDESENVDAFHSKY